MMENNSNKSGIHPIGDRVLICPEEIEEVTASGIVLHSYTQAEKEQLAQVFGRVVEFGDECWPAYNRDHKPIKVGDRVIFGKYAGMVFKGLDSKEYRILRSEMIHSKVDEGVRNA
jgi:chaperonin GroES